MSLAVAGVGAGRSCLSHKCLQLLKEYFLVSYLDHLIWMLKLTLSIYSQQLSIVTIWGIDLDLLVKPLTKNWY